LSGFTYSGGLLRHEKEVHGKYGGPVKQIHCLYNTCKRHTGKSFTRQENLNEHSKKVHTDSGALQDVEDPKIGGQKRKRTASISGNDEYRQDLERIQLAIKELKRNSQELFNQIQDCIHQSQRTQALMSLLYS